MVADNVEMFNSQSCVDPNFYVYGNQVKSRVLKKRVITDEYDENGKLVKSVTIEEYEDSYDYYKPQQVYPTYPYTKPYVTYTTNTTDNKITLNN